MPVHNHLILAPIILLTSITLFGSQEREAVELARGVWTIEYEGNVVDVLRIERYKEYQSPSSGSSTIFSGRIRVEGGWEIAVLHLRTERIKAKRGLGVWHIVLVSLEGKKFFASAISLGGASENQFDPAEQFFEVLIDAPVGTRFEQIILSRERDDLDPKRREEIIIELPGGA